jgi:signal peptide peptidase SppA
MSRHGYAGFFSSSPGMLETGRTIQRLANDPSIYAIVLAVDSPGGTVTGTFELADTVFQIREAGKTKIVSVADAMMASAAMAVGAAAGEVYAIPSGTVGSIGVLASYSSYSEFMQKQGIAVEIVRSTPLKARFSGIEPLTDAMLATMQKSVNEMHGEFVAAMAKYRGVSPRHVEKRFGRGETLRTLEAIDAGLVDAVGSVDEVVGQLISEAATNRRSRV